MVRLPTEDELVKKSIAWVKERMLKAAEEQIDDIIRDELRKGASQRYGEIDAD